MPDFNKEAEKRITAAVTAGEQFMAKRSKLWQARYNRAMSEMQAVEEFDEAVIRLDKKFPHLNLIEFVIREQTRKEN